MLGQKNFLGGLPGGFWASVQSFKQIYFFVNFAGFFAKNLTVHFCHFAGYGLKRFFSYNSGFWIFQAPSPQNRPCWTTFRKGQKKFEASFLVKNASKDRLKKHFEFLWTFLVILGIKEASNRFSTFLKSCSAWSILGRRSLKNPKSVHRLWN